MGEICPRTHLLGDRVVRQGLPTIRTGSGREAGPLAVQAHLTGLFAYRKRASWPLSRECRLNAASPNTIAEPSAAATDACFDEALELPTAPFQMRACSESTIESGTIRLGRAERGHMPEDLLPRNSIWMDH